MSGEIKRGDRIRIKPEYQDPGDADFLWFAASDVAKGRLDICSNVAQLEGWRFNPVQTVRVEMVERIAP